MNIRQKMLSDFKDIGIKEGEALIVHSSLSSLGHPIEDGANTVIEVLLDALTSSGTLLFPGLSFMNVTPEIPVFDIKNTSCCVGIIPETFRKNFAEVRSMHPTHSVCATGPLAKEITKNHHLDTTPCGPNSPFALLPKYDAKVLMLGCSLNTNTSMHAIEELDPPEFLFGENLRYTLIDVDGKISKNLHKRHGFKGLTQRYDRIPPHMPNSGFQSGKILNAQSYLIDLKTLWKTAIPIYQNDSRYFVEEVP